MYRSVELLKSRKHFLICYGLYFPNAGGWHAKNVFEMVYSYANVPPQGCFQVLEALFQYVPYFRKNIVCATELGRLWKSTDISILVSTLGAPSVTTQPENIGPRPKSSASASSYTIQYFDIIFKTFNNILNTIYKTKICVSKKRWVDPAYHEKR